MLSGGERGCLGSDLGDDFLRRFRPDARNFDQARDRILLRVIGIWQPPETWRFITVGYPWFVFLQGILATIYWGDGSSSGGTSATLAGDAPERSR